MEITPSLAPYFKKKNTFCIVDMFTMYVCIYIKVWSVKFIFKQHAESLLFR